MVGRDKKEAVNHIVTAIKAGYHHLDGAECKYKDATERGRLES